MLPTPSFLFTGPLILIMTLAIAFRRQELYEFVEGFTSTIYENKGEDNLNSYFEKQKKGQAEYRPPLMEMDEIEKDDGDIREIKDIREIRNNYQN